MDLCMGSSVIFRACMHKYGHSSFKRLFSVTSYAGQSSLHLNESPTLKQKEEKSDAGSLEFRKLDLYGKKKEADRRPRTRFTVMQKVPPPRYTKMPVDQDWPSVWPTAQSFKASVVPLPLRQGFSEKGVAPDKHANAELMKIPNFLHLTPPAISRHCEVLKQFCSPWPKGLESPESCRRHFPLTVVTHSYCHSSPSIRDERARIVTIQIKLADLHLNAHATDKFLRLVGDRYTLETDTVTIVTDRCPFRKQNYDYAIYLLTALYHESLKTETWESEKEESDMEYYIWEGGKSEAAVLKLIQDVKAASVESQTPPPELFKSLPEKYQKEDIVRVDAVAKYAEAVTDIHNKGEDLQTTSKYSEAVLALLHLPRLAVST